MTGKIFHRRAPIPLPTPHRTTTEKTSHQANLLSRDDTTPPRSKVFINKNISFFRHRQMGTNQDLGKPPSTTNPIPGSSRIDGATSPEHHGVAHRSRTHPRAQQAVVRREASAIAEPHCTRLTNSGLVVDKRPHRHRGALRPRLPRDSTVRCA